MQGGYNSLTVVSGALSFESKTSNRDSKSTDLLLSHSCHPLQKPPATGPSGSDRPAFAVSFIAFVTLRPTHT